MTRHGYRVKYFLNNGAVEQSAFVRWLRVLMIKHYQYFNDAFDLCMTHSNTNGL